MSIRSELRLFRNIGAVILATNLSSLPVPYMQRALGIDKEIAAFRNYYSVGRTFQVETEGFGHLDVPSPTYLLYGYGMRVGHTLAYGDDNFEQTARRMLQ